jgi:phage-related protein
MHECGFAGTIMADKTDTFAHAADEIDARKSMDGAETLFDAVQSNDGFRLAVHRLEDGPLVPEVRG